MEYDNDDNYDDNDNSMSKSGVGVPVNDNTLNAEVDGKSVIGENTGAKVPFYRLDSDFGDVPYWNNGTIATSAELYMLSIIVKYSNMDGLHGLWFIPQYGFNRRMKEFGKLDIMLLYPSLATIS